MGPNDISGQAKARVVTCYILYIGSLHQVLAQENQTTNKMGVVRVINDQLSISTPINVFPE